MRIDEGKLIALLVERTDYSHEEAQQQLGLLKDRIRKTIESDEVFEISHFGTFFGRAGTLHFEPSEQLKTEINQKYAGMRPIELMEPFRESGAGIPVEETPKEPILENEPDDEEALVDKQPGAEKVNRESDTGAQDQPELPHKKNKQKEPATSAPEKEITANSAKKRQIPKTASRTNRRKSSLMRIVAVVIGIVILGAGWLLYTSGVLNRIGIGNEAGAPADTSAAATSGNFTQNSNAPADTAEQNETANTTKDSTNQAVSAKYGLKGEINVQLDTAYTIVIHSFQLKSTIRPIADSLHEQGYRTLLLERKNSKVARWRLGLGQFKTRKSAREAARTLPAPYKQNHFIARI